MLYCVCTSERSFFTGCPSLERSCGGLTPASSWRTPTSPSSSFFPQLYLLNVMSDGLEYPWDGSAVLAVSRPNSLCASSLLAGGVRRREDPGSKLCSARAKTSPCYQCCFQLKSKPQLLWVKLTLSQSNPAQGVSSEHSEGM